MRMSPRLYIRVGIGSLIALFALTATVKASGNTREVQIRDECDPATFNAALGPGTCVGDGDVTLDEFFQELTENKSVDEWRFNPTSTTEHRDVVLKAVNRGGEAHTFTKVAVFGGGFVQELNSPLGFTMPVAECENPPALTFIQPGQQFSTAKLAPGTYRYMCCIHPWMKSVVTVRTD